MDKGKFIVFEGLDGSGKSLQIEKLVGVLSSRNIEVWPTAEPSKSEIGKLIRAIQKKKVSFIDNGKTLKYLYMADRVNHAIEIKERLDKGITVICDRYWISSVAYQDSTIKSGESAFNLNDMEDFPVPDLTIYLDTDVDTCLSRLSEREDTEIFENREYLNKVKEGYDNAYNAYNILTLIPGNGTVEEVHSNVMKKVDKLF